MTKQKQPLQLPLHSHFPNAFPILPLNQTSRAQRRRHAAPRLLVALALIGVLLLTVACGPGGGSDSGNLEEATAAIARDFAASGDIDRARNAVQALDVANPLQWLIYSAESAIASNNDPALTQAYVRLALEMGVQESTIRTYAEANGMIESSEATAITSAATLSAAVMQPVAPPAAVEAAPGTSAQTETTAAETSTTATGGVAAAAALTGTQPGTQTTTLADAAPTVQVAPTDVPPAQISTAQLINLRTGPGTEYNLSGSLAPGETATIVAKNGTGDWWQIRTSGGTLHWVFGALVTATGAVDAIALASDIPTPPPATIAPTPASPVEVAPTAAPAEPAPAEQPTAEPIAANPADQPHFTLVQRRMWTKEENGACAGQHLLRITVVDVNGSPLNGVALQGIYTGEILVTGDQGKGDGRIEYDLYSTGEGFTVLRNNDGRDATSDRAEGFTTMSLDIPVPTLIEGGYCSNEADCQIFYNSYGCTGHHSWEATFKRNY